MADAAVPDESQAATPAIDALPARIRDIAIMRGLGYKHREIGRLIGVTPQAVSVMLQRHRRAGLEKLGMHTVQWELSARAANVLGRLGVTTRGEAREKNITAKLRGQRNCGQKTIREIERWLAGEKEG